jgi:chromosome segregation ATPase
MNLSQQNWAKEREDLISSEKFLREEYEAAKHAMQDWEVIALEERAVRESLGERLIELEDQISTQKAAYAMVVTEKERESNAVVGLQRSLQDIQNARKQELRDVVESTQAQISQLIQKGETLEKRSKEAESQLLQAQQDLQRVLPFEKEVKEKGLLIGKLRHEAVTLNDHLRKALRMLKRDNADDKIDKQLVTNVFLQFVSIQRGDAKKYEVLQLIASVLDWNDEQREKAGLVRPGTSANSSSNNTLKTPPLSPFHRSPSTPTLSDAYDGSKDLWTSVFGSEKS